MPQLVFVHGVATRNTPEYKSRAADRDTLFRELLFADAGTRIHSPVWGDFVPVINPAVFDTDKGVQTFSLNIAPPEGMGAGMMGNAHQGTDGDFSIAGVGRQDPVAALDAICSVMADRAALSGRVLNFEECQAFRQAAALIEAGQAASLFEGDGSAQGIASRLAAGAPEAFGIGSLVGDAITDVSDRIRNAASTLGFSAVRGSLSPAVGLFMGDVFVYLKEGEHRRRIRGAVRQALVEAQAAKQAHGGPLVVVGHSLGGVILVDMLADPQAADLPDGIAVDALLTVGSQPGLFAALGVLGQAPPPSVPRRKPACVGFWMNVFDAIDPLAFRAAPVFADVEDLVFNSVAGIAQTHSKYFQRPQFYARARARLKEKGIL